VKRCARKLDPLDAEAVASGADPVFASDAAAHAGACPECGAAVDQARGLGAELSALSAAPEPSVDLASRVVRLRAFSRRERLGLALWGGPSAFAAGLAGLGVALLGLPGLSGREQLGLTAAALLPAVGVLRSVGRWLADLTHVAPAGLESLSSALRHEQALGLVAALLFVPLAFGLKRVLARARR
jgi:hypothetical protein